MANQYNLGEGPLQPVPPSKGPVEKKVTVATFATYVGSVILLYVVIGLSSDPTILSPLPDVIEPLIVGLLPTLVTFLAAYNAKHTFRNDRDAMKVTP